MQDESTHLPERKKRKVSPGETGNAAYDHAVDQLSQDEGNDELSDADRTSKVKAKGSSPSKRKPEPPQDARQLKQPNSFKHIIAMKTARAGYDRLGNNQSAAATRRKKRPIQRPASPSSSSDEVVEIKPPVNKGKAPAERPKVPTVPVHAAPLQKDALRDPSPSHKSAGITLSPRTITRLAEFDALELDVPNKHAPGSPAHSEPPIAYLEQPPSSQSDGSKPINGRVTTKSKKPRYRAAHPIKPSSLNPQANDAPSTPDMSIVPETDPESSNPNYYDRIPSPPPRAPLRKNTPHQSPSRISLVKRMQGKTPSPTNPPATTLPPSDPQSPTSLYLRTRPTNAKSKPLRPLPMVSPSVFHQIAETNIPESSVPESRIESDRGHQKGPYTPSPIEHFSSPENSTKGKLNNGTHEANRKTVRLNADTTAGVDRVDNADVSKPKKSLEIKSGTKRSLEELLKARKDLTAAACARPAAKDESSRDPPSDEAEAGSLVPDPNSTSFQDLPDIDIDLTVDSAVDDSLTLPDTLEPVEDDDGVPFHIRMREEEEETTQEAMMYAHGQGIDNEIDSIQELESQGEEQQDLSNVVEVNLSLVLNSWV